MTAVRTPWRAVAAAFALNGLLFGTWAARVPAVKEMLGLDDGQLGVLLLMIGLGAVVSFPFAGRYADMKGAQRATIWILGGLALSLLLIALAPSAILTGVALFLFGLCYGGSDVTMNSWGTEVEKHLGRSVISSLHAMWSVGAGAGALLSYAALQMNLSVAAHFTVAAIFGAVVLGPFMMIQWTSQIHEARKGDPWIALPRGSLLLLGLIAFAGAICEGAVSDWSAVYLRDAIRVPQSQATLGFGVFSVAMVCTRLCADAVVTRIGPRRVTLYSAVSILVGIALIIAFDTLSTSLAGFAFMGVGIAAIMPLTFSRAAIDPKMPPGQGIAAVATLRYAAMFIGPPAIGFISDTASLRTAYALLAVLAILIAILSPVLSRTAAQAAD